MLRHLVFARVSLAWLCQHSMLWACAKAFIVVIYSLAVIGASKLWLLTLSQETYTVVSQFNLYFVSLLFVYNLCHFSPAAARNWGEFWLQGKREKWSRGHATKKLYDENSSQAINPWEFSQGILKASWESVH